MHASVVVPLALQIQLCNRLWSALPDPLPADALPFYQRAVRHPPPMACCWRCSPHCPAGEA